MRFSAVSNFSTYLPAFVAILLFAVRCAEMAIRKGRVSGEITNPGTWWAMLLGGSAVVIASVVEYALHPNGSDALFFFGFVIGLSSFALRAWAAVALGKFWSMHIEIRREHPLVQSGPYAWVRHPIYTAAALELIGALVMLHAKWSWLAFFLCFIPAVTARIRLEERAMVAHFGEAYRNYIARVPALVPFKLPGGGQKS